MHLTENASSKWPGTSVLFQNDDEGCDPVKPINLEQISPWLQMLWDQGGSDLLLTGGSAPRLRVDGQLRLDSEGHDNVQVRRSTGMK